MEKSGAIVTLVVIGVALSILAIPMFEGFINYGENLEKKQDTNIICGNRKENLTITYTDQQIENDTYSGFSSYEYNNTIYSLNVTFNYNNEDRSFAYFYDNTESVNAIENVNFANDELIIKDSYTHYNNITGKDENITLEYTLYFENVVWNTNNKTYTLDFSTRFRVYETSYIYNENQVKYFSFIPYLVAILIMVIILILMFKAYTG